MQADALRGLPRPTWTRRSTSGCATWRAGQARALGQPAYCVFTDKTLMAIAEAVPDDEAALAGSPGWAARKLGRFGADVLALCAGADPADGSTACPEGTDSGDRADGNLLDSPKNSLRPPR